MIRRHLLLVLACTIAGAAAGASFAPLWPRYTLRHVAVAACIGQVLGALVGLVLAHRREGHVDHGTDTAAGRGAGTDPDLATSVDREASAAAPSGPEGSVPAVPSVPVLGVVPALLPASGGIPSERPERNPFGELAEQLVDRTERGHVLAVCAAHPTTAHDGVVDELARALSAVGRRVLVVDARTVTRATVAAGATPAEATGFDPASLTPARLAQVLRRAAASADLLLLAAPPVSTSAGERIMGCADAVLLVAADTPGVEEQLHAARHAVAIGDAQLLGVVLVHVMTHN